MKKQTIKHFLYVLLLSVLTSKEGVCLANPAPGNNFFAGTGKILITPETPIPMSGYGGRKAPFKGIHDDLFARVIVISDGTNKAVLITTDLIGLSNAFWKDATDLISLETGIHKDYVLLAAVHNHSGPVTKVYNEDSSAEVNMYVEQLKKKIVIAVKEAIAGMVPVSIGAGKGVCKMNINRRAMDGAGGMALGRNPYAPCDHEVGVIYLKEKSGHPLAILMNWPCHGTVLGPNNYLITGDWPGAASRYVEKLSGGKTIAPVFVGASGDINPIYGPHIDFENHSAYSFGMDAIGEDLGKESLRVAREIKTSSSGKITAMQRVISLPVKARLLKNFLQPESIQADSLKVRLSAIKIGNIILTGVSGEVFNQISVRMRKRSPYPNTFMITHCNGSSGYLVTEDAYPKKNQGLVNDKTMPVGGYEVQSTTASTGAEAAIISNLLNMIGLL